MDKVRRIVPEAVRVARINAITAVLVALISAVGGLIAGVALVRASQPESILPEVPPGTTTTTRAARPQLKFEAPSPEGHEVASTCNIDVHGSGAIAQDQALVIAIQEYLDPIIWFEGAVQWRADNLRWEANVRLGVTDSAGKRFTIYAVVLDSDLAKYLMSTNRVAGARYWSSPQWPPGSVRAAQVDIRRSGDSSVTCPP
jgi:hypothetical protein